LTAASTAPSTHNTAQDTSAAFSNAAAVAPTAPADRAIASAIVLRALEALAAAHAAGYVHCDVRPHNIVVVNSAAMLIDWGLARKLGARFPPRSVTAFSDERLFIRPPVANKTPPRPLATPSVDALAALYTWLAIAHGSRGAGAPWLPPVELDSGHIFNERRAWIAHRATVDTHDARIARAIAAIEASSSDFDALAAARAAVADAAA
jgi:serine/threonine protein kinase